MRRTLERYPIATRLAGQPARALTALLAMASLVISGSLRDAPAAEPAGAAQPPAVIDAAEYPSLQAAFDAVPETGGLVRLPPGSFQITEPLVLSRSNTRVVGAGAATRLVNVNTEGKPALIVQPLDADTNRKARLWRVQLADFRICGDPQAIDAKSTQPKSGDGLLARYVQEIYLHGMSIDHNGGHGVNLIDCYEDPRVADCIITYNAQAGLNIQGCHDIVVSANHFEENQDAVRCLDSFNLCMNGNNLDDHLRHGVVIENTYGSVVSGNMIEECEGIALVMDRDCYGNTVSANIIAHDFGGGVDLRDAWGCAVSANTFTMCKPFGVRVGPAAGRIAISANSFSNAHIGGENKREDASHGVVLQGTEDVCVAGNTFTGMQQQAVAAEAHCRRIAVTGNLLVDLDRAGGEKCPPIDLKGAEDSLVEQNLIHAAVSTAKPTGKPAPDAAPEP